MQVNPYLWFNGNCEEAFKFYELCFGGKIEAMMTHAGTPAEKGVPAEWGSKIMHAMMRLDGGTLMASDVPPSSYQQPNGFHVSVQVAKPEEAERIFATLTDGGKVSMPLAETFWALRFGMLVDRFGVPWMINCSKPM
jgi:PhnB protein